MLVSRLIVGILVAIYGAVFLLMTPQVSAQTLVSASCANVDVDAGMPKWGNNTHQFTGTFFEAENSISVVEIALPMFRQASTTANNSSRWVLYEVSGVPSTLGTGQVTFLPVDDIPLWSSTAVLKSELGLYSSFTAEQLGDPANWPTREVDPPVQLEAGKFYAVGAFPFVNGTTSFAQQIIYGLNSSGDCGIDNVLITAAGQGYTTADDWLASEISAFGAGCPLDDFTFGCDPPTTGNASALFALYGVEIVPIPTLEGGNIDDWVDETLTDYGLGDATGKILFVGVVSLVMLIGGIMGGIKPLIIIMVVGLFGLGMTLATLIPPQYVIGAMFLIGVMLVIGWLVMRGNSGGLE